jgi:hypothetical protein
MQSYLPLEPELIITIKLMDKYRKKIENMVYDLNYSSEMFAEAYPEYAKKFERAIDTIGEPLLQNQYQRQQSDFTHVRYEKSLRWTDDDK